MVSVCTAADERSVKDYVCILWLPVPMVCCELDM